MHIIHITNNCNRGGSNHVILPVSTALLKKKVKCTFLYLQKPDSLKAEFIKQGINTICIGKNPIKILFFLFNLIKKEDKSKIIFHTHLVHGSLIGRLAGKLFNIPVITTRHYEKRSKHNLFYLLEDLTIKYSNHVIAISNAVKKYLNTYQNVPISKCSKIYNPIMSIFSKRGKKLYNTEYQITFVGRLNPIKGVKYLIQAFEEICLNIANAQLVIIGRDDGSKIELEKQVSIHPNKDRIIFADFLSLNEVRQHLLQTNVYVQPSLREGLGISAMEAMSMECPCIFTKVGGLIELANKGQNAILVPDQNSKSIADAVLLLNKDDLKSKLISKNAKEFICNNFNTSQIANQHYQIYQKLLSDNYVN